MLSEAKDTSELMVDLAYAALYYNAPDIAEELGRLEDRLSDLAFDMRAICLIAARSRRDAEEMAGVLNVVSAIEKIGNAAVDIAGIVTRRLGIPSGLRSDLEQAEEVVTRVRVHDESTVDGQSLADLALPTEAGMRVIAIRRGDEWDFFPKGESVVIGEDISSAAQEMVWVVEEDEDVHPVFAAALRDSDEVVVRVTVMAGSQADGRTVRELAVEMETGVYLLAVLRDSRWRYRPRGGLSFQAGDDIIGVGPGEGAALLAEMWRGAEPLHSLEEVGAS